MEIGSVSTVRRECLHQPQGPCTRKIYSTAQPRQKPPFDILFSPGRSHLSSRNHRYLEVSSGGYRSIPEDPVDCRQQTNQWSRPWISYVRGQSGVCRKISYPTSDMEIGHCSNQPSEGLCFASKALNPLCY